MNTRKINNDTISHTFRASSDPHDYISGSKPTLVDDGEVYKIHIPGNQFEFHGGFKKIMVDVQADESNTIVQFYAVIDVYYVPPSYLVFEKDPVKLGRVNYSGNLIPGKNPKDAKWNTQIIVSSPYTEKNSAGLPAKVLEVGPGAFITAIIQSLFGTLEGIKLLNLEGYKIPDAEAGINDFKVTH